MKRLDLALIPSVDLVKAVVAFQERSKSVTALRPVLDASRRIPHVSLFQGPFVDAADPQRMLEVVEQHWLAPNGPSHLTPQDLTVHGERWLMVLIARDEWLTDLHEKVLAHCEPFIDAGAIVPRSDRGNLTPSELESYQRYGYRYAGPTFLPHITVGHELNPFDQDAVEVLNRMWFETVPAHSGPPTAAVCFVPGVDGEITRVVARRNLAS